MRETSLETSPPTLHALGLRLTLVLGAIEVLARSDHSKSQTKIALTVEDEQQALLPPCWCIKLDDSLWQGARLAIFHTTALWVQIVPAEQSDIAGFVAEGEQVTVIIDRSAGLGKDRMLHWEISVLDPRVEDVWAELERSKKTLNHQMTGELARALSQRGIETSKQEEFECIQSQEHKHMTGELMAVMRQRSEKINDMDSSADSPRQAHVEGSKKPENKQMSGELMDIIARRSAKFNDTNTILDSLSEEQFEHGKKPVPKQMTGELIDVLKQRSAKYYAVDSPPEPVLNVERNTLDGCSAQQVLQEVYSKSIALAKEQQKLTAGGETSPKAEEAWLPPAQSVETPTGRPPRLKVEEPNTAEKTARKAEKEAPGAESNEQLSFKAQESAELPAEVSADFRAMPSTAWTSLHAQFAKNAEPEKAKEDATRTRGNTHDEIWLKGEKYVPMLASSTSGTAGDPTEEEADDVSARAPVEKQSGLKPPGLLTKTAQDKKSAAESQARAAVEAREPLQAKRDVSINKDGAVTYKVKGEATLSGGQHVCLKVEQSARLRAEEARLQAEDKAKTFGTIRNTESWKALRNDGTVDACIEKEVIAKMKNKYDTGLEKSVRAWIEEVTGQKDDEQTFAQYLKDGQVLCSLVNAVRPGMIKKVHTSKMPFKQMENVTFFMKAARELGVIDSSIFASRDLYEERNMDSVVMCIYRFAGVVQVACPEFLGPFLGNAINPNSGKEKKRFERQASE